MVVQDNDHFALNTETHTIFAMQYENIVIPCKPTSPDVQVSLWTSKRKEVIKTKFKILKKKKSKTLPYYY